MCDEVHIFYNPDSQGTHFDMGVAFAYRRKIVVVENVEYGPGKSYPRMLDEWAAIYKSWKRNFYIPRTDLSYN